MDSNLPTDPAPAAKRSYTAKGTRGAVVAVTVTIAQSTRDRLDARARKMGVSRSLAVERALQAFLADGEDATPVAPVAPEQATATAQAGAPA